MIEPDHVGALALSGEISIRQGKFADAAEPEDVVFDSRGLKVLIDPRSLPYLEGTELDYTKEGLNEGFKFNNPNVKDQCGCGESFNV